jgi:hypothetical protein
VGVGVGEAMKWALGLVLTCAACAKPKYDCTRTRQVLAKADVYQLRKLPASTVWRIYPRSIENEARLRRYLDAKVDANRGGEAPYTVECHAVVCKVEINERLEHMGGGELALALHGAGVHSPDPHRRERAEVIRDYENGFAWLVETGGDVESLRKPTRCRDSTATYVRGKLEHDTDDDDDDDDD